MDAEASSKTDANTPGPDGRPSSGSTEEVLCGLFAEVLGKDRVGADDDLFAIGGHSLSAIRLLVRIRSVLGVELAIRDIFDATTPAALAKRIADTAAGDARTPLAPMARPEIVPLSFAQRRLWFLHKLEGRSATYNVPLALRLTGAVDTAALRAALLDLVARHESLRTVFPEADGGEPYQLILAPAEAEEVFRWEHRQVPASDLPQSLQEAARYGFDLAAELPLRAWLFESSHEQNTLLLLLHHIAGDGWSMGPLARDVMEAYTARVERRAPRWAELPVQYADYALWQREQLGDMDDPASPYAQQVAHWLDELADLPAEVTFPADRPRPAVAEYCGARAPFRIDAELHRRVVEFARRTSTTVFMVLQAGMAALLTRLGAGTDIALGSGVAGRTDEAMDDLIGLFVNTYVLRTDTSGDPSFDELLGRVRERSVTAHAHQDVPFEHLVELLNPLRSTNHHPLFQVAMVLQNAPGSEFRLPGLQVSSEFLTTGTSRFDLLLELYERHDDAQGVLGIESYVEYSTELFDRSTVEGVLARWVRLLEQVVVDPSAPIGRVELLTGEERVRLLSGWNDTAVDVPGVSLVGVFEEQVRRAPDATALEYGGQCISYGELNVRANRLAHWLVGEGVGPERLVALELPRSVDLVVAVLAVQKAGGAYLPVDPAYPRERREFMLRDAAPLLVLDAQSMTRDVSGLSDVDPGVVVEPGHPAYVIYTSGSTGTPKGVVVTHRGVSSLARAQRDRLGVGAGSRVLQFASPSFDAAFWELVLAFGSGGVLVVPVGDRTVGEGLLEVLSSGRVTHVTVPASVLGGLPV
ncbi:condensation domain-containing protein, partial [Streptomyces sp. NPDC127068]|uniref:condensation domain-containing protein n=1 Tax=Streptomyces sp. NPDC127068 TaxID=3347127 RepID=UPI00364B912C